jgi:branched-subunit amino acid transport protein
MMDRWLLIAVIAALTYLTRIAGFVVGNRPIPPRLDRFLSYVPVSVFAALVVPNVAPIGRDVPARVAAVILTAVVAFRVRQLWAGIGAGMVCFWMIRAAGG